MHGKATVGLWDLISPPPGLAPGQGLIALVALIVAALAVAQWTGLQAVDRGSVAEYL